MKWKSCILGVLLISNLGTMLQAQRVNSEDTINISNIKLDKVISSHVLWYTDTSVAGEKSIAEIEFRDTIPATVLKRLPVSLVQKVIYLRFALQNPTDSAITIFFHPGFYFDDIKLFRYNPSHRTVQHLEAAAGEPPGCRKIIMQPNKTQLFISRLHFVKTSVNTLKPTLVRDFYLSSFFNNKLVAAKDSNTITFVFSGLLLMMIFYSLAVFLQNRSPEFLLYSGFAFCLAILFFLKSYLFKNPSSFNYLFESYLDFFLQALSTFIYIAFLRKFLHSKTRFPLLEKVLILDQLITILSLVSFTYLNFFTNNFVLQDTVENLTKYAWSLGTVIFIVYAITARKKLLSYLAVGHFFLLTGGLISLYLIRTGNSFGSAVPAVFNNALIYYEIGLTIELIFFLAALAYKNKFDLIEKTKESERLNLQNERQELEKQLAVITAQQDERNRISLDMHDELGSGVTAISLMSDIVQAKMKENTLPEIYKISHNAKELINKMNTIIWTMKSENDSVQSLITYIRTYAMEFFENTMISCSVDTPSGFSNIEVSGEKRRNIFLSVKETLNNVLKHSKAEKIEIRFALNERLTITIVDNGVGIDLEHLREFGTGLKSIKKRMESVDGRYMIESLNGSGTKTIFEVPV